jgi:EAL domain-containing protein (putative c-di-GMP-specific phosphodiesterase class I)/PAS domain-containing protein
MPWALRKIAPYLGAIGALVLVCMVLVTMYFTWLSWQWITFLSGILGASILSLASRSIHVEWLIARRTAQLAQARQKLANETRMRTRAEQDLAGIENNIAYLHESLPAMLAYIDPQHHLKYHNRAFRHGLGTAVSHIDGRHLREVVGNIVYRELEDDISCAFDGSVVHCERLHKSIAGESFRLLMQYLPQFNDAGAVAGVFLLSTDITAPADFAAASSAMARIETPIESAPADWPRAPVEESAQTQATPVSDAVRLRNALEHDEFCLFFHAIEPVTAQGDEIPFREILLRLKAEEESMMPPGSFLPVAEEHGMLPDLDRWVVRHLLGWMRAETPRQRAVFSINISAQTMADPAYPAFVKVALRECGLPGSLLCFEFQETDAQNQTADVSRFIGQLQAEGCRFAICGFGGNRASFDLLRRLPVNFLKIDGSLILHIRRSAVDFARVKAIHRVAQAIGVRTIAECVEDSKTLARLRSIGVDFAQGFAISRPQDLAQIALHPPVAPQDNLPGCQAGEKVAAA